MKHRLFPIILLALLSFWIVTIAYCAPGISVVVDDVETYVGGTDNKASYVVRAESITNEDENVKLSVSGDPGLSFDWTTQEFVLTAWTTQEFPLEVTVAVGTTPGNYEFIAFAEAWPTWLSYDEAVMMGLIETSSYTKYVIVSETVAPISAPEFPIEVSVITSLLMAALLLLKKRDTKK